MNIPNTLTIIRLLLIPAFIVVFFLHIPFNLQISVAIFLLAGFTDILDGYIARKYNIITKLGIVMDPLADKLMLLAVLSCLVVNNFIPFWVLIIMLIKECSMISIGFFLYKKNVVIPANVFGKTASLLFYISIFLLINKVNILTINVGKILIYIAVFSAITAFINYMLVYMKRSKKSSEI